MSGDFQIRSRGNEREYHLHSGKTPSILSLMLMIDCFPQSDHERAVMMGRRHDEPSCLVFHSPSFQDYYSPTLAGRFINYGGFAKCQVPTHRALTTTVSSQYPDTISLIEDHQRWLDMTPGTVTLATRRCGCSCAISTLRAKHMRGDSSLQSFEHRQ